MIRESLIRHLPEIAFALLFGGGLVLGGDAALAGLPKVLDAAVPAAQAGVGAGPAHGIVRLAVSQGFVESRLPPQVLYSITATPKSDGLTARVTKSGMPAASGGPVIAICIDDLGEDLAGTDKAMALPRQVALSFLPYADGTPFLAEAAAKKGHLVLAHVPMQALNGKDPGPTGLKPGMAAEEIARRLDWNLSRVPRRAGINNHEGSRFTADAAALAPVMASLKARHLFFFDSRTGPRSAVGAVARAVGVMSAERDIFLDDDPRAEAVGAQLEALVHQAKRNGVAIAIGHPHDVTLKLLAAWLAQDRGVTLVPLDEAIRITAERATTVASR